MKIIVDAEKCIGCMTCSNLCPECFEMKDGKSSVKNTECEKSKSKCDLDEVIDSCPVEAISKEE
ncbi:MAG: ferredoxin [bacterium]